MGPARRFVIRVGRLGRTGEPVFQAVVGQELPRQQTAVDRMHGIVGQAVDHQRGHLGTARRHAGGIQQP
ncbi:hypothetical protein D3C72_2543660 [compost metagenome]